MLEIINVSKIYKSNQDVNAIKTTALSLSERGMVFILGKSGSGKSTLLNLIGGIDDPTSGDIIFKNRSLKDFTTSELDDYRNYHIGFIFQEFNLISQLSVRDNVSLGLEIQNRESISVNDEVNNNLKRVDMVDFINRKAGDLSGGEKQRIAIARALIRNPEIILADEPTGNLDIENSHIILDLLKQLSRERLVIIVTHDRDFAYRYADRIIELSDGTIISDKITDTKSNELLKTTDENNKSNVPRRKTKMRISVVFKFLLNLIAVKRGKQVLSIFLFSLALFLINLGLTYYTYDFNKATTNVFEDSEINELGVYKNNNYENGAYYFSINQDEIDEISNLYPDMDFTIMISRPITSYGFFNSIFSPFNIITDSPSDVLSFTNITIIDNENQLNILYGTPLQNEGDIAISDYSANLMIKYNTFDGEQNISSLIGKTLTDGTRELRICAILDTDYELFYSDASSYSELYKNGFSVKQSLNYSAIHMKKNTYDNIFHTTGKLIEVNNNMTKNISIASPLYNFDDILIGTYPTAANEIAVSLSTLEIYLGQEIIAGDITGNSQEISQYIGETVLLDLEAYNQGEVAFTVTGILDDFNTGNNIHLLFSQEEFEYLDYNNYSDGKLVGLLTKLDNNSNIYNHLTTLLEDYDLKHLTIYSAELYNMDTIVENTVPIIEIIAIVLIVISFLMLSSHMSYSILVKSREIGIFRSLGVHKIDIAKIYILQNFILILISYLISIVMTIVMVKIQNQEITSSWNLSVGILYIDSLIYLYGLLIIIVISVISSLFPTFKISKLQPIKAIRNI